MNKVFNSLKCGRSTLITMFIFVYNIVAQISMMALILYFPSAGNFGINYIIMLQSSNCIFKESCFFESRIDIVYSSLVLLSNYKKNIYDSKRSIFGYMSYYLNK